MSEPHQVSVQAQKSLIDGRVVQEFTLTEFDEDGVYGSITMSEKAARSVGKVLRNLSAPDPRLGRRIILGFLKNPVIETYQFFRHLILWMWRGSI